MDYSEIIKNDESLQLFMDSLREFNQYFNDRMTNGDDYTISLEVRGCKGEVLHCRAKNDGFKRPRGVEKRIETEKKSY